MTIHKNGFLIFKIALLVAILIRVIIVLNPNTPYKYTIYAGDKVYHCNQFIVTGRTIYFRDITKKNVCINGEYTLIYETEDKK